MYRLLGCIFLLAWSLVARAWHFDIIGDTPYSAFERQHLPDLLNELAANDPAFIVHVGDIKGGSAQCDDSLFEDRRTLFDAVGRPIVYLPGDNDWTDCHRKNNGAFQPEERLAALRRIFFDPAQPLGGKPLSTDAQPGYPENRRWQRDSIVFVTVHLVGSYDNFDARREHRARSEAGRAWLTQAAAIANDTGARALVIFAHGDPHFKAYAAGNANRAFVPFLNLLRAIAARADHQVVFVHGDSHTQMIDQPLLRPDGTPIETFTRVQSFGYPFMGWIRFSVTEDATHPLRIEPFVWAPDDQH